MTTESISLQASRRLRKGSLPHVPPPASPTSSHVTLVLHAESQQYPEAVFVDPRREHGWRVALEPGGEPDTWRGEIRLPQEPTVLRYYFEMPGGTQIREIRQIEGEPKPLYGVWEERDFQISVYDPHSTPPEWVGGAIIYQLFPDRFAVGDPESIKRGPDRVYGREAIYNRWSDPPEHPPKSRDFYGGDLRGVIDKLDYLQELGITCIYFTPIFESPTNHRYDAIDYMKIDPRLGTEADFRDLIQRAGERGIRVMLDGVFNHCSSESIYFKDARRSKLSPYYRWFNFIEWPEVWYGWLAVKTMPEFVECPEVEEFFFGERGVARHWLSYGTVGWRTDVTPWITDEYWRRFRRAVRRAYPEAYLVSEDWGNASHRLVGDQFDGTMNYRFGYTVWGFAGDKLSPAELDDRLQTLRRDTPEPQFYAQMNLIGSHDTARLITMVGSRERVMLAAALQLAYPGAPMIYYGDETGIPGEYAEDSRRPYPWGSEDQALLSFYKRALNARRASPALSLGDVHTVWIGDAERGGYGLLRRHEGDVVAALFNNGSEPLEVAVELGREVPDGEWADLLGQVGSAQVRSGSLFATVPPLGAAWFRPVRREHER